MTHNQKTFRRLRLGLFAASLMFLAACGSDESSDEGSDESLSRDAILASGLSSAELDCILDDTGLSASEYLEIDSDDGSDITGRVRDAFAVCVNAEEDDAADDDGASEEPAADDGRRAEVVASGLTEGEIDCILDTTDLSLDDLVALSDSDTKADGSTISDSEEAGVFACFESSPDSGQVESDAAPDTQDEVDAQAADQEAITSLTWAGDCSTVVGPCGYGDDADLDQLWEGCAAGNGFFCDLLYTDSPVGSEYEHFGDTCGERGREDSCEAALGSA